VVALSLAGPSLAGELKWPFTFTEGSSPELIEYDARIHDPDALRSIKGTPVRDVTFKAEHFEVRMDEGVVYLEPEIDGHPAGAFFVGRATVSFAPRDRTARRDMILNFGSESLESEPVGHVWFFTMRESSLLGQLGIEEQPAVPFDAGPDFAEYKKAVRRLGTRLTHVFLNRDGLSKGAAYVVFAPPAIRDRRSPSACLLYSFDPGRSQEITLQALGHHAFTRSYVSLITRERSTPRRFVPEGRVEEYSTDLTFRGSPAYIRKVDEVSTITLTAVSEVTALRLELTPRLEVSSVTGPGGRPLPFLQWEYRPGRANANPDPRVLVLVDGLFHAGETGKITVTSSGPLVRLPEHEQPGIEPWHPRLNDPGESIFELRATVPKRVRLETAGELLSEAVESDTRRYHYRTTRPSAATAFAWGYGPYGTEERTADDTVVTVQGGGKTEYLQELVVETANQVRVLNRILAPLESDSLRVADVPPNRAFDGFVLLGDRRRLRRQETIARLWFGNMLRPLDLPRDYWLVESFAAYMAVEYLEIRNERDESAWRQLHWHWPLFNRGTLETRTLKGGSQRVNYYRLYALIDGVGTTTKGPLVLHSLRYLFAVRDGSDNAFWLLVQDFVQNNKHRQVSTRDFLELAEARYGESLDWFWDQWLYGTDLPVVRWSKELSRAEDGGWLLTVNAEQLETEMTLHIPIYVVRQDGETIRAPLILRGRTARATVELENEPLEVSLNDDYEAIVRLEN
jgi:hypothetical protein